MVWVMVDNTIALQVRPLDIATPLMQAAKMRQMESEQQRLTEADNREQVASAMRGLAPYADSPEFGGRWQQTIDDLAQRNHIRPDIAARMRDNPSQLQLRSVLAQSESPEMQFRRVEADRAQSNADRAFKAQQEQAGAPTITSETHDFMGNKTGSTSQRIMPGQAPYAGSGGAAPASSTTGIPVNAATGEPMQGQELLGYLKKTDPVTAAGIESIIRGDTNAGGRNLQKMLPLAALIDPSLQQFDYATRAKTGLAFGPAGKVGLETKAMNTAFGHANRLAEISEQLGGVDFMPGLNPLIQGAKREMNVEGAQKAQAEWKTMSGTLAVEVSKALNGGQISEGERHHWRQILSDARSPQERKAAISEIMRVLEARLNANAQAWVEGMGPNRNPPKMIYPENQKIFDKLRGLSGEDTSSRGSPTKDQSRAMPAPVAGAKQAQDGNWYLPDPDRPGKYLRVEL